MTMNFRETTALLREAESRDTLAAALKGGKAAKEFRQEREALEKAAGGKKKLEQADKYHAERIAAADAYFAQKRAKADDIENEIAAEIGRRTAVLKKNEQTVRDRLADADVRDDAQREERDALAERERRIVVREKDAKEAETANANTKEALESTQARLAKWEQALDARDARVREAVA